MIHKHILLSILVFFFSVEGIAQDEKTHIIGHVMDGETNDIIPFATAILYENIDSMLVEVSAYETDQTGKFEFFVDADKTYRVLGNAREYLANEVELGKLKPGKEDYIGIFIDLEDITGYAPLWPETPIKMQEADTKKIVPLAEVSIYIKRDGLFEDRVWSRSYKGGFTGYFVPGEMYKIIIKAPGYQEETIYFLCPSNKEIPELEFYLHKN